MAWTHTWWALGVVVALGGCSSAETSNPAGPGNGGSAAQAAGGAGPLGDSNAGTAGGSAGTAGTAGGIVLPGSSGTPGSSCGEVGNSIFVVSSENVLLKFSPTKLTFSTIGDLACPTSPGDTPFSMAVDRDGFAFVLYQSGTIYKVDTTTAACKPSGYSVGQQGWNLFGMGYVADATGGVGETLFIIDNGGQGLGQVSAQGKLSEVGQFNQGLSGRTAEVTGLGDGRLFAFFVDVSSNQSSVAEIDKDSGQVLSNVDQALGPINAWAFAHWGGSFYLFHGSQGPSKVTKYTPGQGSKQVVDDAGYRIVGAGVSTCAPTVEPPIE